MMVVVMMKRATLDLLVQPDLTDVDVKEGRGCSLLHGA